MAITKEQYYQRIKDLFVFEPVIKEIHLSNINKLGNFNCYICKFKIKDYNFKFALNYTNKGHQYIVMFYNSFTNKHEPRPIKTEEDIIKFIYVKLLNLFLNKFNKNYIDFNDINFIKL
jgi:hypothetical protein